MLSAPAWHLKDEEDFLQVFSIKPGVHLMDF